MLLELKKLVDSSLFLHALYEKVRGIYALLKLLHEEKAFAINVPR